MHEGHPGGIAGMSTRAKDFDTGLSSFVCVTRVHIVHTHGIELNLGCLTGDHVLENANRRRIADQRKKLRKAPDYGPQQDR